jgi:regulation of enolase protein 1 (concanavalin A-like superfamily)
MNRPLPLVALIIVIVVFAMASVLLASSAISQAQTMEAVPIPVPTTVLQVQRAAQQAGAHSATTRTLQVVAPFPLFDPTQLVPGRLLPGEDYPPNPLLATDRSALQTQAKPAGIDLDVTYIERLPKYNRYWVEYNGGKPSLRPGTEFDKRWPAPGEIVTFMAHVVNKGTQFSGPFQTVWLIDGQSVQSSTATGLQPGEEGTFTYQWPWNHRLRGEQVLEDHVLLFRADAQNQIAETFENNNERADHTNAMAFFVAITPEVYAALESSPRAGAPYSAEDWIQKHAAAMNDMLMNSIHDVAPLGGIERVRIDKILVTSSNPVQTLEYDGQWYISSDYRSTSAYYHPEQDLDWGLVHEWGHQIGLIDTYRYNIPGGDVLVLRQDGSPYGHGYNFPGDEIMDTILTDRYSPFSTAGLNTTKGYRRGYYGEFQFDVARTLAVEVRDITGCAVQGAQVNFYQRTSFSPWRIDNHPEFSGSTLRDGRVTLANRSVSGEITTATNHTLHDTPFGIIDVVGPGNMGLLRVIKNGAEQFQWLTVPDLNVDYWRKSEPSTQVIHLPWSSASGNPDCDKTEFSDEFSDPALDGGWRWLDPHSDSVYTMEPSTGRFVMRLYGDGNDLFPDANLDAPRLLQYASGDFSVVAQVEVAAATSYQGAGLLIWQDERNYVRFERANHDGQQVLALWHRIGGSFEGPILAYTNLTNLYLRIQRIGNTFRFAWSSNGNTWSALGEHRFTLNTNLQVGVAAINQWNNENLEARFYKLVWEADDLIFGDGFESGDLSRWSVSTTDGGDLSVSTAANLIGDYGIQASIDDNETIYVTDDSPTSEPRYHMRFYFDPNTISMANGNAHSIFYGYSDAPAVVLRVEFRFFSGQYQLRVALLNDGTTWKNSSWFTISDAPHIVELFWTAATGAGTNNGGLTLFLDDVLKAVLNSVDNDTRRIDSVRLGPVAGIDTGTRGIYYFDAFESRRQTYIGPAGSSAAATKLALDTTQVELGVGAIEEETIEDAAEAPADGNNLYLPLLSTEIQQTTDDSP